MGTWILIMTMFMADTQYKSANAAASVESVSGFKSRESCLVAANMWLKQMRDPEYYSGHSFKARAMCVQQ